MARKKKHTKSPTSPVKMGPSPAVFGRNLTLLGLLVLGLAALAISFSRNATVSHRQVRPTHSAIEIPGAEPVGWEIADTLLADRAEFAHIYGLADTEEWSEYTTDYFRALKTRRDAVIAWAASRTTQPSIVFIGLYHTSIGGDTSSEEQVRVNQAQTEAFERVQRYSREASVIAIEEAGSDEILTLAIQIGLARAAADRSGIHMSDDEIRTMLVQDRQAATRSVLELSTPVICGEEWPIKLESYILRQGSPAASVTPGLIGRFLWEFNLLRSEIILIRTLEFLRRADGSNGIILQGNGHRQMIERLTETYHISFLGLSPNESYRP